jgi:hypothetical protein
LAFTFSSIFSNSKTVFSPVLMSNVWSTSKSSSVLSNYNEGYRLHAEQYIFNLCFRQLLRRHETLLSSFGFSKQWQG